MSERSSMFIRVPSDLKAWLSQQSELHGSSQNSEAIRAIRERMERVQAKAERREGEAA
jgi:hypothetical protein